MYTLYSMQSSGNSYKVRLALARLGIPYNLVEIDILKGESRTPEFLAKNPNGQVPLLEVAPDRHLAESNAILWYVAGGSMLAPEDRIARAEALQWMFFEQHSLEPNIGAAYFWLALIKGGRELQSHALEDWMENGYRALGVMETHLTRHRFFVADHFTIADIALYAYTHVADQADFDLNPLSGDPRLGSPASPTSRDISRWTGNRSLPQRNSAGMPKAFGLSPRKRRASLPAPPQSGRTLAEFPRYPPDIARNAYFRFAMCKHITSAGFTPPATVHSAPSTEPSRLPNSSPALRLPLLRLLPPLWSRSELRVRMSPAT